VKDRKFAHCLGIWAIWSPEDTTRTLKRIGYPSSLPKNIIYPKSGLFRFWFGLFISAVSPSWIWSRSSAPHGTGPSSPVRAVSSSYASAAGRRN
jgi:hypothetical protein